MGFDDHSVEIPGHGHFAASTNQEIPMNTFQRLFALAVLALVASAFGIAQAFAAEPGGTTPLKHVRYDDLNLSREAGVRKLYERIKDAAEIVCAPFNGRQLSQRMNQVTCVTSAMERAVRQVNEPALTGYYLARNPKSDIDTSLAATR
jgi:UrcA family protein